MLYVYLQMMSIFYGPGDIDMGLVNGTKIHVMKFAPLGDPVEIKVKNFELALRTSEAGMIDVEVQ